MLLKQQRVLGLERAPELPIMAVELVTHPFVFFQLSWGLGTGRGREILMPAFLSWTWKCDPQDTQSETDRQTETPTPTHGLREGLGPRAPTGQLRGATIRPIPRRGQWGS